VEVRSHGTPMTEGFWGKVRPSQDAPDRLFCLPLTAHCLDVACVFRRLAGLPTVHSRLEGAAGGALDEISLDRLAVVALLHDLGKANLGFQAKLFDPQAAHAGHVREIAPLLFEPELAERLEAILGQIADWFARPDDAVAYLLATWSHHGRPLSLTRLEEQTANYSRAKREWWQPNGGRDPFSGIEELLKVARDAYPSAFFAGSPRLPSSPPLQHRFAGLVMLADWLGSHESFFPIDRQDRFDSRAAAERSVGTVGLEARPYQERLAHQPTGFRHRFGFAPRPLQALLRTLPTDQPD
jgi:CRISPR-associated endonuclease/helicase Cas3